MSDAIKTFLARVLPWSQDGASAFYNIHWMTASKKWRGRACKTLDDLVKQVIWLKAQGDVKDIYVCMSSQKEADEKKTSGGRTIWWAKRSAAGALLLKSLFLDVDVKAGAYSSTQEALKALIKFLGDTGMPEPTLIVATGSGGFHCHWVLDTPLDPDAWGKLARALVNAAKQHGFNIDPGVATDCARILRVPDTLNYKHTPPKPVLLGKAVRPNDHPLDQIIKVLAPYMVAPQPTLAPTPGVTGAYTGNANTDELGAGIGATFVFDDFKSAVEFLETQTPNPFAIGGYDGIRDLMFACVYIECAYPEHAAEARALFAAVVGRAGRSAEDNAKRYGAALQATPAKIKANDASLIKPGSIFKMALDKGWSAPKPAPTVQPGVPAADLPPGYTREVDGTIWFTKTDKQGLDHQVQVHSYPMEKAWISKDPLSLNFVTKIGTRKKDRTITLPHEKTSRKETMAQVLAGQGFMLKPLQQADAQEFILAWITHLQNTRRSSAAHAFGWTVGGFAYGGVIQGTGAPAGSCDPNIARQYEPCGDIKPWIAAAKMVSDQRRPALDAIVASAFAGPLVKLLGQDGLLVSAYNSESGIGKTTALRIAQSVWGHPIEAAQVLTDTLNATVGKLGEIRNLPLYWDEIKSEEQTEKFINLAFQLSSGRDKARMTQHATQRKSGTWETLILSCSNDSIVDSIASVTKTSQAGVYRCFEFFVPAASGPSPLSQPTVQNMVADLKNHFGQAGLIYAAYLGGNQAVVETFVKNLNEDLFKKVNGQQEERYWIASITAIVAGAMFSNQLALTSIDVKGLLNFLVGHLTMMRSSPGLGATSMNSAVNVADVLTRFMRDMRARNTLCTDKIHRRPGRAVPGTIQIVRSDMGLTQLKVQIALDDRVMRCGMSDLGDWLRDNKYSVQTICSEFRKHFGMRDGNGSLGTGTLHSTGSMRYWEFDLGSPQMSGFFDTI